MLFRRFIISASLELCKVVSNHLFYQVWIIRVIKIQCCDIHRKLCVQMKRSRDLHYTQVLAIFLSAGTLHSIVPEKGVRVILPIRHGSQVSNSLISSRTCRR